jgi:hypothetical protein
MSGKVDFTFPSETARCRGIESGSRFRQIGNFSNAFREMRKTRETDAVADSLRSGMARCPIDIRRQGRAPIAGRDI